MNAHAVAGCRERYEYDPPVRRAADSVSPGGELIDAKLDRRSGVGYRLRPARSTVSAGYRAAPISWLPAIGSHRIGMYT